MVTASNPSFDACRPHARTALQMLAQGQQWREQIQKLQQRRLERDRAALEGTLETLRDAHDWSDFAAGSQTILRDYLSASAALWQESVAAAMQGAGAWTDATRDAVQGWQDAFTAWQPGQAAGAALPMREWMAAFERSVGVAPAANGAAGDAAARTGKTAGADEAQTAYASGGQHAG